MKTLAASLLVLGLFAGTANAKDPQDTFKDLNSSAPHSAGQMGDTLGVQPFDRIQDTAPRSPFDDISASAPRSDGPFGTINDNAP